MQHTHPTPGPLPALSRFYGVGASWRSALPLLVLALCFTVILLAATSCGGFDATAECQTACDRYASCHDATFDVGTCTEQCSDQAVGDADFQTRVNTCDACVEDSDCVEGEEFLCAEDCAGIISP